MAGLIRKVETAPAIADPDQAVEVNWWCCIGVGTFVVLSLIVGLGQGPFGQEIMSVGSMSIAGLLLCLDALEPYPRECSLRKT